jgi:hypothetical protein
MPRYCLAGWRHRRLPSPDRPHWPLPYSGRASSQAVARPLSIGTDREPGGACQRVLCWLSPAGRLASGAPAQPCPAEVAGAGCGLPSRPAPWSGLAPPLRTMRTKTPPRQLAGLPADRTPPPSWRGCRAGASGAAQVLRRLSSCLPRPEASGGPARPCHTGWARVACGSVHTLGVRNAFSELYQHCRGRGHPCGLQDTLSTLRPACSPRVPLRLRHGRQPRYGWGAGPSPTGTFTLQETPSFSWRENAWPELRLEAGARYERTLEAVRSRPLILLEAPSSAYPRGMLSLGNKHAHEEVTSGASTPTNTPVTAASTCMPAPWTSVL